MVREWGHGVIYAIPWIPGSDFPFIQGPEGDPSRPPPYWQWTFHQAFVQIGQHQHLVYGCDRARTLSPFIDTGGGRYCPGPLAPVDWRWDGMGLDGPALFGGSGSLDRAAAALLPAA